jgi:hypothetical protein
MKTTYRELVRRLVGFGEGEERFGKGLRRETPCQRGAVPLQHLQRPILLRKQIPEIDTRTLGKTGARAPNGQGKGEAGRELP